MLSIIIPLYNKSKSINKTLLSIINQTYKGFEVIIVDDGSTDDSVAIAQNINDNRFKLYSKDNGGPSSARNFGLYHSKGEWIVFLDADDYFEPNALNLIIDTIKVHPYCNFFCFNHYVEDMDRKKIYSDKYKNGYIFNNFYSWCVNLCMPRAGAAVFKKKAIANHLFKEQLRRYEDAEALFELMRNEKIYQSSIPIMTYCRGTAEASAPRKDISEDFIGHLNPRGKGWWEQYALYQLYIQGCHLYPDDMKRLYSPKEFITWKIRLMNRYLYYMRKFNLL